jgi:acetylornithine deacetylase/succinyl-diaminopimelate desuccinylase-like protein
MFDDLRTAIDELFPAMQSELEDLVRIPSVSAAGFDPGEVRRSAQAGAELLEQAGFGGVRLLELDGAHPGVFGEIPAPPGAPTVLLYAHHDVQPPGPADQWETAPFEPFVSDGRVYGRGTSDDKCGIIMHTAAVRAFGGRPPVGVKVFIEGEEEIGSTHLGQLLDTYGEQIGADAIVIADSGNWDTHEPALTTSLRGLVDCEIEVRTLDVGVHSGMWGGAIPDALTALVRTLATLHDAAGNVAIPGLVSFDGAPVDMSEDMARRLSGMADGVEFIGSGSLTSRMWSGPSASVLAIDATPVAEAINQLIPVARAKVSVRLAPGDDPARAMTALTSHLEANVPWGAQVKVTAGAGGQPFALDTDGPAYDAWRAGFREAFGRDAIDIGVGGSIPFVPAFSSAYPEASILLTGAGDPASRAHGPNESLDLADFKASALTEAIAFRELAG